jgi:hypothetical protein
MSSLDWPPVDANGVSIPSIVSSSDLFDGDLFGDELIDIYNSAVIGEHSDGKFIPRSIYFSQAMFSPQFSYIQKSHNC